MITNTTAFKLKASKSSQSHDLDNLEDTESVDGDATGDSNYRYQVFTSRDGKFRGAKSKFYDPKTPRSSDRRTPNRGPRASNLYRRNDYPIGTSVKIFDPYKYADNEKKTEVKFNLPEDTRISKLLRRLSNEEDQENSLQISKKLLEVLLLPDNASYVRKSFNILRDSMLHIFQVAPGPLAKQQCAKAFGRMGYILGQDFFDFTKYTKVILKCYPGVSEEMLCLFMEALKETFNLERQKPVLEKNRAYTIMQDLIVIIESTDNIEIFKLSLDNLMSCIEFWPKHFCEFFKDTIDLLFGWHVDHTQPLSNIEFISKSLQRISSHFQMNLEFSITLILHFVEDIETYTNQLKKDFDNTIIEHLTVFILALNTVLKCLNSNIKCDLFPNQNKIDALTQVVKTVTEALEIIVPDNLIIAANESISILLSLITVKSNSLNESILQLVDLQLSIIPDLSDSTIISTLLMISKIIKELSANLPIDLIPKLVGPQSEIIKLRNSPYSDIQEATICVYQALLNLKNIPLLQEAYKYVLSDLEMAFKIVVPNETEIVNGNLFTDFDYKEEEAELVCLFLLRSLSQLANASGSIIGMWALKPSILELLGVLLQPFNKDFICNAPALQYSILYLLFSHCKCYNYFISSSTLVTDKLKVNRMGLGEHIEDVAKSPNSGNFSIILDVLYKTFLVKSNDEIKLLLLHWFKEILIVGETYLEVIYTNKEFMMVTEMLVRCGYSKNPQIVLAVGENLERLLGNKQLSWRNQFLIEINKLCVLHMGANNEEVAACFSKVSCNVPWDVAIIEMGKLLVMKNIIDDKKIDLSKYDNNSVVLAQHLHLNGTLFGEMSSHHFKNLMNHLLKHEGDSRNLLENVFINSWPLEADHQELTDHYRDLCMNSQIVLTNWATWEAAQLCINNKLRTPLGKPNETFTSFETSLKNYARDVMRLKQDENIKNVSQKHVRILLQFIEHLEICIYNASEGSAIAIPQPAKPVRTFFTTNASTCREWLSRIRIVLLQLSLHAGLSVMALRHGQELLKDLVNSNKMETVDFERGVMYVTQALLNLRESEAIQGLYVWSYRKYDWLKCAADQANKKYEVAALGYKKLIDEAIEGEVDVYIKHFLADQIVSCYKELNSWLDVVGFKNGKMKSLLEESENGMRYSFNTVNFDCAQSIFNMETSAFAFNELTTWQIGEKDSWSTYDSLNSCESDLYNIALNIDTPDLKHISNKIDDKLLKIQKVIQDDILQLPSDFLQNFCLLNYVGNGLKNVVDNTSANSVFLVSENFENEVNKIDSPILSKILWWSEYFSKVQNQGFTTFSSNLRLNIIKKARKESNFNLASSELYRFLNNKSLLVLQENCNKKNSLLINIAESFKAKIPEITMWNLDTAKAAQETIKLLYNEPNERRLAFDLSAIASTSISKCADMYRELDLKQVSSKILLKLASWLQSNDHVSLTEITSPLGKLLMVLPEIAIINIGNNVIPLNEMVIGKLLQFSVSQCQTLAKTWNAFGTWCYRWGRKIVDNSSDFNNTLSLEDQNIIQSLLPLDCKPEDLNRVLMILSQTRAHVDEEDIDSNEINTSEMIKNQLKNVSVLFNAPEELIDGLVQIWRNLQKRIYAYYELSVEAYFKYLHLATNNENVSKATESNTITVTLRLLRLIVKHALELQNVLEQGLSCTPTHPWKVIIPQLFSRLNHPESYVRERVSELLCKIAEDAPHLITFPAVVGALEGGVKFDFSEITLPKDCLSQTNCNDDADVEIEDNYESDNDESKNVLQACFKSMVETLSKQAPETITQVQLLVKELRRIILLWDELWLGTLSQHHSEISKRQQQLEAEIEKVNSNANLSPEEKISLITEKHRIIIKPIIFILEQLHDITSVEAETPHEEQFQERFMEMIEDVLRKLKNPENPDRPQESWKLLKELQNQFQLKAHKRTLLKMKDISPILANIKDTEISMPGQALKTNVRISQVSNQVSILPTKTKPKKLIFHGSDGHTYTYLFKGLEDLHLDERIMQFLSIANTMMAQNTEGTGHNLYRARHYSVIPLGPRSGLISWVSGTTPVFALYKRWQQREATKTAKNSSNTILRPSELFYNKLNPLLQEHGVKNIDNRKEWPLVVLKQVLQELMRETPSDLLGKELWCHSVNPGAWWQMVRKYSYSVAVMSMIGYIIGLGDRHLDNVLVDLNSGEVVHIDYNVCFEKGKTLRVPEKVPFRLTPNIRDALGVTGVEGMFRMACENILKTMKKGRETLLTLLEAFVYDPLIDWTVGNDGLVGTTFGGMSTNSTHRQTRKDLEREVTLAMYRVRCTEMKIDWEQNRNEILEKIPKITENLQIWQDCHNKMSVSDDRLQDLHQQMALVKEAEANGLSKHPLLTLPSRYESFRKGQDARNIAKKDLDKLIQDCEIRLTRFADAVKSLQTQQYQQWFMELSGGIEGESVFGLVKEFLQNAGQAGMITQCEQLEGEVNQLSDQLTTLTIKCLNILQEFWVVYSQCPLSFLDRHRCVYYLKFCKILQNSNDLVLSDEIYQQFYAFKTQKTKTEPAIIVQFSYHLNLLYNNTGEQLAKAFEELNKSRAEESNSGLENIYKDSKMRISNLIKHEKGAAKALEFVIVTELLLLNRTFLTFESTASKSGDWLIKLTSREGDWFLDELTLSSSKAIELINYLTIHNNIEEDAQFMNVVHGLQAANNMYKSLHELNFNFHTIILPESVKKIQSEEPSVMQMICELKNIILGIGIGLPELVVQLEKHLTSVVMKMEHTAAYEIIQNKVTNLKLQYQALLHSPTTNLTPGKMLLMGFNGLFDKLNLESTNLVNILGKLEIPTSWRKLDHVKEAKSLAAPIFNPQVRAILDDIFLLKRLQTMYDFFTLCMKMYNSFQGQGNLVLNDEQFLKPIRKFIADFISRQFLGITTEEIAYVICLLLQRLGLNVTNEIEQKDIGAESKVPLDELYRKGWNIFLKNGVFTQNVFAQVSSMESNVKIAWEKLQEPKKLEKTVALLQSSVNRIQHQITTHNWLFEDVIPSQLLENSNCLHRKIIQDLKVKTHELKALQCEVAEAREKQKSLIASVEQRLKWAAGANPDLNDILSAFERAITVRDNRLDLETQISTLTLSTSTAIVQHEILRNSTPESSTYDKLFLNGHKRWTAACEFNLVKIEAVSMVEENIMKLYSADMEPKWINAVSEKISETIKLTQKELATQKNKLAVTGMNILTTVDALKIVYGSHCKIMNDFKILIKSMVKIDETSAKSQQFITEYRNYIDKFSSVLHRFKKEGFGDEDVIHALGVLEFLSGATEGVYRSLMHLEDRKPLVRQDGVLSPVKVAVKQESLTKGQQRNAYAVGVWRRVRMKLEGRDPDPGRKYSTQEQVDYVIREASSLDNLALLYEGWTPWV